MTWGTAWGPAWGPSFADAPVELVVITGSGELEQLAPEVTGSGYSGVQVKAAAGGGGGNFSRARLPTPQELVAEVRRDRVLDALGMRLFGAGEVEQPAGEVSGSARIKLVSLVATSASVEGGPNEVSATAEFRDVELEMVALLLAA